MTKLDQLHDRYGHSPGWTTSPAATSPAAIRCATSPEPMWSRASTTDEGTMT
jgi:hypothetical protein